MNLTEYRSQENGMRIKKLEGLSIIEMKRNSKVSYKMISLMARD
jgi:hypothetical protein